MRLGSYRGLLLNGFAWDRQCCSWSWRITEGMTVDGLS